MATHILQKRLIMTINIPVVDGAMLKPEITQWFMVDIDGSRKPKKPKKPVKPENKGTLTLTNTEEVTL